MHAVLLADLVDRLYATQSFQADLGFELRAVILPRLRFSHCCSFLMTASSLNHCLENGDHYTTYTIKASTLSRRINKTIGQVANLLAATDFYAAYDSISCPQQKCLIHLMRDLNDETLNNPFDEELKSIAISFADLLKPIVDTIDRRGLRKSSLRKHLVAVDRFYRFLGSSDFKSDAARKCQQRFEKNRDKLFTFLRYDNVPWNNNNAEHAIKAFARLRDVIAGSSTKKGVVDYLTLLSIAQTCEYRELDFLDFLRSREKDVDTFARDRRRYSTKTAAASRVKRPDDGGNLDVR